MDIEMAEIYMLTSPSGRQYIGVTKHTAQVRLVSHRELSRNARQYPLNRAIRKYGWRTFKVQTLLTGPEALLYKLEGHFIESFKTLVPNGYNVGLGGEGVKMTPEIKQKLSEGAKEFWKRPGYRERQSAGLRASLARPECRAQKSVSMAGNTNGRGKRKVSWDEVRAIQAAYTDHMVGRVKAKNGFLINLRQTYPHLSVEQIYRARDGNYVELGAE